MDTAIKAIALILYIAALAASLLKTFRIRNCENEDWYVIAGLLMAFFIAFRLTPSVLIHALVGVALVAYTAFAILRLRGKKASYELSNVSPSLQAPLNELIDSFVREHSLDPLSVQLNNKRPYRIVVKGVSYRESLPLLRSVNKTIRAHGIFSLSSLIELLFLLLLGGAIYIWLMGICLTGLIR